MDFLCEKLLPKNYVLIEISHSINSNFKERKMPRKIGSPAKGTYCSRCGFIMDMSQRRLISTTKYEKDQTRPSITTHKTKKILSFGLCKKCYAEYEKFVKDFTGGKME